MTKATFRIPDHLLEDLRLRSQREGRSINAVVVEALRVGLGKDAVNQDVQEILGPLLVKPATAVYSIGDAERLLADIPEQARDLWGAFEWTRGES